MYRISKLVEITALKLHRPLPSTTLPAPAGMPALRTLVAAALAYCYNMPRDDSATAGIGKRPSPPKQLRYIV